MNNPLVSIVVPAYNVSNYIKHCIDSILSQTYEKIELIVVNDGSTDNTLSIIESFNDKRLIVIDQKNAGVSAARNKGIAISKGDYLVFVDGDDSLEKDFVQYFVKLALDNESDFVFSTKCITNNEQKAYDIQEKKITNSEATAMLLNPDVIVGCWNKMYKVNFIKANDIVFSESLFYGEGLRFITTVSQLAKNIVTTNAKKYFYRRNNVSSATTVFNIEKYHNGEKSLFMIYDSMTHDRIIDDTWKLHVCLFYLGAICEIIINKKKKIYKSDYRKWISYIRKNCLGILFSPTVSFYRKSIIFFGSIFPSFVARANVRRKARISKKSIN